MGIIDGVAWEKDYVEGEWSTEEKMAFEKNLYMRQHSKDELNVSNILIGGVENIPGNLKPYNFNPLEQNPAAGGIDKILKDQEGKKDNKFKLPMSKIFKQFPRALQAVILTSCYGHNKYKDTDKDWMNFSRVEGGNESYFDADIRHQLDREIYGESDESGLPHVFHEAFDKLAKCELWIKENNIDIKEYSKKYLKNLADNDKLT